MKRFFYKDCAIEVFIEAQVTAVSLVIRGYYASVELPEELGSVDSGLMPTKESALYAGVQLAQMWRLQP